MPLKSIGAFQVLFDVTSDHVAPHCTTQWLETTVTDLVEFHGVVCQIVMDVEVETCSILRMIIPIALEAQNLPILTSRTDFDTVWVTNLEINDH